MQAETGDDVNLIPALRLREDKQGVMELKREYRCTKIKKYTLLLQYNQMKVGVCITAIV